MYQQYYELDTVGLEFIWNINKSSPSFRISIDGLCSRKNIINLCIPQRVIKSKFAHLHHSMRIPSSETIHLKMFLFLLFTLATQSAAVEA